MALAAGLHLYRARSMEHALADNTRILQDVGHSGADRATKPASAASQENTSKQKARKSRLRYIIFLLLFVGATSGAVLWWIHSGTYESTDDAQVNAHLSAISSRVVGTVTAVYVEENQFVKVGQPIADLDPRDYQNALDQATSQMLQLAIRPGDIVTRQASVRTSEKQVIRAKLDLSYTKIVAPVSGIVSRRSVEIGQHVNAGQQMVQIAQIDNVWVTANFKETQLRHIHPGQRVIIHVDAFKQDLTGHVESLPASTGAITSLLPPENATGNYVKVIQRLPVRIRFEPDQSGLDRLRPGMSVEPKVQVE